MVEALTLLLGVCPYVLIKLIKLSVKDMDFEGHPATHLAVVCHQGFNKHHIVFSLAIPQEAKNHCDKAIP